MTKKILCFILTVSMILSLAACGKSAETDPVKEVAQNVQPISGKTMTVQYSENYYPFPGGYTVRDVSRIGTKLLLLGAGQGGDILGIADYTSEDLGRVSITAATEISLDAASDSNEALIYDIAAGGDGYFYVLTGNTRENYSGNFAILRYSEDGIFQDKMTINDFPDDTEGGLSIAVGNEGDMVLMGLDYIYFLTWQGVPSNKQTVERASFTSAVTTSMGIVLSIYNFTLDASPFFLVDSKTGNMSRLNITNPVNPAEDVDGFKLVWGGSNAPCQGLNGEFVSNSVDSFVLFDFENDHYDEILQWGLVEHNLGAACRLSETSFVCVSPDSDAMVVTGMEVVPYVEKTTVNVALVGIEAGSAISEMNASNQNYDYQVTEYRADEVERFQTELSAGKAYDLVLFGDSLNTSSDYFDDLYPYIDSDSSLSRDSFLPNLLESTSFNGELHQLWNCVAINSLVGNASYVGDGKGITPTDCLRIVNENEQIKAVFDTFMSKESILSILANVGINICVDEEAGTCHFDDAVFSELLTLCNSAAFEGRNDQPLEPDEYILNPAFLTCPIVDTFNPLTNDRSVFVGFPNGGDGLHYYGPAPATITMAIPKTSQNKDGAWAFIREQLSVNKQLNIMIGQGIPSNYEAAKRLAEEISTEDGKIAFYDLLNRTTFSQAFIDDGLREIIVSSGMSYLAGDKTLEETVSLIQSRASIYVAEQYG